MQYKNHLRVRLRPTALALTLISAFSLQAGAADEFDSGLRDSDAIKDKAAARERVEQVNPQDGNLLVRHVDLHWKGNGGLDLVVHRNYDLRSASAGLVRAYSSSFRWWALGPGWDMVVAPRWVERKMQKNTGIVTDLSRLCDGTISTSNAIPDAAPYIELPDGGKELLTFVAPNRAVSKGNWLATCAANRITVYSPDGTVYDLGDIGTRWSGQDGPPVMTAVTYVLPAIKATDPHGNWLSFQYRKVGASSPLAGLSPTSITASDGRAVTFTYDETTRRLLSMQDNAGRTWSYSHVNLQPDTASTAQPIHAVSSVTLPNQQTWSYSYVPGGRFGTDNYTNATYSKLQTLTYPEGGTVTFEVEPFTHATTGQFTAPPVKGERIRKRTLSTGESWEYQYTRGTAGQYDTTVETGPAGTFTYKYMGYAYVTSPDHNVYVDNLWRVGMLMEKSDDRGNTETYAWAPREIYNSGIRAFGPDLVWDRKIWAADLAQRTIVRDGATYVTRYSNIDAYGNVGTTTETGPSGETRTTTRTFHIDTARWIVNQVKDESTAGDSTTRVFNAYGDLESMNKNGIVTSHTYDAEGNIASTTFPRGLKHTYSSYKRGVAQTEVQPEGVTITREVDDAGNVASETNGEGRKTSFTHDGGGRITSITPPAGLKTTISYGANSKVVTRGALTESTSYDGFGRVAAITLGGITHTYAYDALGRKTFASYPGSSAGTHFDYDSLNRVVLLTHADGSSRRTVYSGVTKTVYDERNNPTTYTYRSYGDPAEQYPMAITAPEASANIAIARDERNLVTSVTQGGVTRTYGYNTSHQLVSATNPETGTTTYGRDAAGNMTTRAVGASGTTSYTYDGQNRLTNVTYPGTTPAVTKTYTRTSKLKSVTSSAVTRTYLYDPNDNLSSETIAVDGINFTTQYGYNGNDQLSSITYPISNRVVNFEPDILGRPTRVGSYVNSIAYWPSGMVKQIDYANGTVSTYGQHVRLWPGSFTTGRGASTYMNSVYSYDGAGNMTAIADSADSSNSRTLGFDKINRLTSINGPWGTGSIAYTGNGNITSQVLGSQGLYYTYDNSNRLASVSGTRVSSFFYDAYGNVTSGSARTYTYDGVPNLRCVNCSNSAQKIEYTYDGLNQRVVVNKAGVKTYEIYGSHGNQLMSYTPGTTPKLVEYIYLGGKRIAQRAGL